MRSSLLFPVSVKDSKILVLDETLIPFEEKYIEVICLEDALTVLKEMRTRSLGQALLFFYSCRMFKDFSPDYIAGQFKLQRPTFDFSFMAAMIKGQIAKGLAIEQIVEGFVRGFDFMRRKRAQTLAKELSYKAVILTICNINGELIYLYEEMKKLGKEIFFYLCETRPYLQGTRLSFWELCKNKIPCKLICDNQIAILMKEEKITCVVIGADRATNKGDIINKVGTYALARLAKHFLVPVCALTQYSRDIDIDTIEIEERPQIETFMFIDGDFSKISAFYPSFDITKAEFIQQSLELKP
jgi:methylthioribose-1-phosphate isomerase